MLSTPQKIKHNGEDAEKWVFETFGLTTNPYHVIDIETDSAAIEIKSCMETVGDFSHSTQSRSGRFHFRAGQHNELLNIGGHYLFIVSAPRENLIEPLRVIHMQIMPASAISLDFKGKAAKVVSWSRILTKPRTPAPGAVLNG